MHLGELTNTKVCSCKAYWKFESNSFFIWASSDRPQSLVLFESFLKPAYWKGFSFVFLVVFLLLWDEDLLINGYLDIWIWYKWTDFLLLFHNPCNEIQTTLVLTFKHWNTIKLFCRLILIQTWIDRYHLSCIS